MRTLLLLIGLFLVAYVVRAKLRQLIRPRRKTTSRIKKEVDMVRCDTCGVHLPEPEALRRDGKHYCCPEHRDKPGAHR